MKIILSRKGFDTQYGGIPNLILPNGKLLSFPIGDKKSVIKYTDINPNIENYTNLYDLIIDLNGKKTKENHLAHLDPDLDFTYYPREKDWKPIFGQKGSAAKHLMNYEVGTEDVFLFFGRFRKTEYISGKLKYLPEHKPIHLIFGYLVIDEIIDLSLPVNNKYNWVKYHPHYQILNEKLNHLYLSKSRVSIRNNTYPGASVLKYSKNLELTKPKCNMSTWKLPKWFYPETNNKSLSYHSNINRWKLFEDHTELKTVGRGQEFIIDIETNEQAISWVHDIIESSKSEY